MEPILENVTLEELEALKEKMTAYNNLISQNKESEQELEGLKEQRISLEEQKKLAGEGRAR